MKRLYTHSAVTKRKKNKGVSENSLSAPYVVYTIHVLKTDGIISTSRWHDKLYEFFFSSLFYFFFHSLPSPFRGLIVEVVLRDFTRTRFKVRGILKKLSRLNDLLYSPMYIIRAIYEWSVIYVIITDGQQPSILQYYILIRTYYYLRNTTYTFC